ncbi:MAG: hypothetical protein QOG94_2370 [Solirubrobacteraceae bacterium]|jgi:hypothetical protein|nr:hypothetical protein [Solirubrobacteraceae bacterium]
MTMGVIVATVPGGHRAGSAPSIAGLTPAQAHALSRSAPLTPAQFKAQRQVAERRSVPLHVLLDADARRARRRSGPRD